MARRRRFSARVRAAPGSTRKVHVDLEVTRGRDVGPWAFVACATIGEKRECARGRNPRLAIASVLSKYASSIRRRRGAFAGI